MHSESINLEKTVEILSRLLIASTYAELRQAEESLHDLGIVFPDDFIETTNRRQILDNIRRQFSELTAPTIILTGWFGSGKTALLHRIIGELQGGSLGYGTMRVEPIEIRLNVANTFTRFLAQLLRAVANLRGVDWIVNIYRKFQAIIGLPGLSGDTLEDVLKALVSVPIAQMAEVMDFLEQVFQEYRRAASEQQVLALVIDELENITEIAQAEQAEENNKLCQLLRILFDNAVREYIDSQAACRSPHVLVIFSITTREELEKGGWLKLRQDTLDRIQKVEQDVNLHRETAEYLMQRMLRLYLTTVVKPLAERTADPRLQNWWKQLNSAKAPQDMGFTFPILPDVHRFFTRRILATVPRTEQILRFRAYQAGLLTLLQEWSGEGVIDTRFTVLHFESLYHELGKYPGGVHLENLIGREQVAALISRKFRRAEEGQRYQLANITLTAITRKSTPIVAISYGELGRLLPEDELLSEKAYQSITEVSKQTDAPEWSVVGDTIHVNVTEIVRQLEGSPPVHPGERLHALIEKTAADRRSKDLLLLLQEHVGQVHQHKAGRDDNGILHVRDTGGGAQLIGEYLVAFDVPKDTITKLVNASLALSPALLFTGRAAEDASSLPFEVTVILPHVLQRYEAGHKKEVEERFRRLWEDSFQPLVAALVREEHCSYYDAFKETLKIMLLLPSLQPEEKTRFKEYERDVKALTFRNLQLSDSEREEWIIYCLGFSRFHALDVMRRLIKVLSWLEGGESLLYDNSERVRPRLASRFGANVPLLPSDRWQVELSEEWGDEEVIADGKLVPFEHWAEKRRLLYDHVQKTLSGQRLTLDEVGKLLFGDTRFDKIDKARVALHLFLKLGKCPPLYWELSDETDDYPAMKVTSGEMRRDQLLKSLAAAVGKRLYELVRGYYLASGDRREQIAKETEKAVRINAKLLGSPSMQELRNLQHDLQLIGSPPMAAKQVISVDLIRLIPADLPKAGEFLTKLNQIVTKDGILAYAVASKIPDLANMLEPEIRCEQRVKRAITLYKNWGRTCPMAPSQDGLLQQMVSRYGAGIGRLTDWAERHTEETESTFKGKVSNLSVSRVREDLDAICVWLDQEVNALITPTWRGSYSAQDRDKTEAAIQDAEAQIKQDIGLLTKRINDLLAQIGSCDQRPELIPYRQELAEHKGRLENDLNALKQVSSSLYDVQFGRIFAFCAQHLEDAENYHATIFRKQQERLQGWLKARGLEHLGPKITDSIVCANKSLRDIYSLFKQQGIDPVQKLMDGDTEDVLALFAAVQLLEALEGKK